MPCLCELFSPSNPMEFPDPLADRAPRTAYGPSYESPLTLQRLPISLPPEVLTAEKFGPELTGLATAVLNPAPTDRVIPQMLANHLSRALQVVDLASPHVGPVHNYGYLTIQDQLKPPLAQPIYNYAAFDTMAYLDEERARVTHMLYGYYR